MRARVFGPDAVAPPRTRQRSVFLGIVEDDPALDDLGHQRA